MIAGPTKNLLKGLKSLNRSFFNLTTAVALSLCAVGLASTAVSADVAVANQGNQVTDNSRGGEIDVSLKNPDTVALASDRFTCESCAKAVIPRIKALSGVSKVAFGPYVGTSEHGPLVNGLIGVLTVTFDPTSITTKEIARAAKTALQADPHNHAPVKIVERAPE